MERNRNQSSDALESLASRDGRRSTGKIAYINRISDGASLPYNSEAKTFDEAHPLTIELREWEAENGNLDLSDRPVEKESLESAKVQRQQEIIELAKLAQNALVEDYAPAEQASWDRKIAESERILISKNINDAPTLDAEARAMTGSVEANLDVILFLANRIKAKSVELYQLSAQIAGKRSRLYQQIASAQSFEELGKIEWNS